MSDLLKRVLSDYSTPEIMGAVRDVLEERLAEARQAVADLEAALVVAVDLRLDSDSELKPSAGAATPPPSVAAPSPTPPRGRSPQLPESRRIEIMVQAAREAQQELSRPVRRSEIARRVDLSASQVRDSLTAALRAQRLTMTGKGKATRYAVPETKTPVTEGPAPGRGPGEAIEPVGDDGTGKAQLLQPPTLQGKILAALQMGQKRIEDLSGELELPEGTVRAAVGRLVREGELRIGREHGETVYGVAA